MEVIRVIRQLDIFAVAIAALKVSRGLLYMIDVVLDLFFGYKITEGFKSDREMAKEYEHSAQIVRVMARALYIVDINQPSQFLYRHNRYVHPNFILNNDNVIMMGVTPTHAFFSITHKPELDLRNTEKMPFLYFFQCGYTEELLILPLSSFNRLASEIGDPKVKSLSIVQMSGRGGSTLLCQMVNRVPNARAISEPWAFEEIVYFHRKGVFTQEQMIKLFQSTIRLLCKPENETKIDHILIKMSVFCFPNHLFFKELFPQIKSIFMTRHPKPVCISWMKILRSFPRSTVRTMHFRNFVLTNFPLPFYKGRKKWERILDDTKTWLCPEKDTPFTATLYAASMDYYLNNKSSFDAVFLYDDVINDYETSTLKLFKLTGIDEKHLPKALDALKADSQKGFFGDRGSGNVVFTKQMWDEIDERMNAAVPGLTTKMNIDQLRKLLY